MAETYRYDSNQWSYIYHSYFRSYEEANKECKKSGNGSLAIANNDLVLRDILTGLKQSNFNSCIPLRIGLSRRGDLIEWIDGSSFTQNERISKIFQTSSSCIGYAIRNGQQCSEANFFGVDCNKDMSYICQEPLTTHATRALHSIVSKSLFGTSSIPNTSHSKVVPETRMQTTHATTRALHSSVSKILSGTSFIPTTIHSKTVPETNESNNTALFAGCISLLLLPLL